MSLTMQSVALSGNEKSAFQWYLAVNYSTGIVLSHAYVTPNTFPPI